MNLFQKSMQGAVEVAEEFVGETWVFNGQQYPGVVLQGSTSRTERIPGGKREIGECRVQVRDQTIAASGVKEGSVILVRGQSVRVGTIESHVVGAKVLVCGAVGLRV